jgi:hypothetical protein
MRSGQPVLPPAAFPVRNGLVRNGVPFIVPRRQMFLPFLAVDLRERGARRPRPRRDVLSGAAQALVLSLRDSPDERVLKELNRLMEGVTW